MKTEIKRVGDTVIVSVDGRLDFETQEPFRQNLSKLIPRTSSDMLKDSSAHKVIFNLENLEFVGSSGISSFVQTLREFNARSGVRPRYCNVGSEFRRVMKAFDEEELFEFYETEERARRSFEPSA